MPNLFEVISDRQRANHFAALSAVEIEHLVLTTVAAALDMAVNALHNSWNPDRTWTETIDPERILNELKEDFTANVQQYWPAPVQIGSARTEPWTDDLGAGHFPIITRADVVKAHELGLTATQIERQRRQAIIDKEHSEPWPSETLGDTGQSDDNEE